LCEFVFLICSQSQKTKGRNDADKFKLGFAGMNEKKIELPPARAVDAGRDRKMDGEDHATKFFTLLDRPNIQRKGSEKTPKKAKYRNANASGGRKRKTYKK
jgi:hypothetical protein